MSGVLRVISLCLALLVASAARGADGDDATQAADAILAALDDQRYESIWAHQSSQTLRDKVAKDDFVARIAIGRAQLGRIQNRKLVEVSSAQSAVPAGYQGTVYAVSYLNTYAAGRYLERVVVLKEKDGKFRLAGLWGTNAPAEPK